MGRKFIKNASITSFFLLILVIVVSLIFSLASNRNLHAKKNTPGKIVSPIAAPQLSAWIAWWEEQKAYDLIDRHPGKIKSVSPVWFMVNKNLALEDIGTFDRATATRKLREAKITIYPTLGSDVGGKQLGTLLGNTKKVDTLIASLTAQLVELDIDGLDVDLEAIEKKDKDKYTNFLTKLSGRLKDNNLKMTVAVHAKTPKIYWEGNEGQDLAAIGNLADEVRVMLYDEHYAEGEAGSISSFSWMSDVINYTLTFVPQEKIVAGIPTYGYLWGTDANYGQQFYEFNKNLLGKTYSQKRDTKSGELVFKGSNFEGWLSDSDAMNRKISSLKMQGINKFIIWHLGGMDEKFFETL